MVNVQAPSGNGMRVTATLNRWKTAAWNSTADSTRNVLLLHDTWCDGWVVVLLGSETYPMTGFEPALMTWELQFPSRSGAERFSAFLRATVYEDRDAANVLLPGLPCDRSLGMDSALGRGIRTAYLTVTQGKYATVCGNTDGKSLALRSIVDFQAHLRTLCLEKLRGLTAMDPPVSSGQWSPKLMRALVTGFMRLYVTRETTASIPYSTLDKLAAMVYVRGTGAFFDVGAEEQQRLVADWGDGKLPGLMVNYVSSTTGMHEYAMVLNPAYEIRQGVANVRRCALLGSRGRNKIGPLVKDSRLLGTLCAKAFQSDDDMNDIQVVLEESASAEVGAADTECQHVSPVHAGVKALLGGAGVSVVHISDVERNVPSACVSLMCMAWLMCLVHSESLDHDSVDLTGEQGEKEELFRPVQAADLQSSAEKAEREKEKQRKRLDGATKAQEKSGAEYPEPLTLKKMRKLLRKAASKKKKWRAYKHPMAPGTEFVSREAAESVMAAWAEQTQKRVKILNGSRSKLHYVCALCDQCEFRVNINWQIKSNGFRVSRHVFPPIVSGQRS